jgi:hypothetical protein
MQVNEIHGNCICLKYNQIIKMVVPPSDFKVEDNKILE